MREIFVWGGGGAGCLQMRRVGIGRRRRNRGGEGRKSVHILGNSVGETIDDSDGTIDTSPYGSAISNPSMIQSAI